jgi:hypothetical protein
MIIEDVESSVPPFLEFGIFICRDYSRNPL